MKPVTISVPSGKLKGFLFYPKKRTRAPAVLFLHGWASAQNRYADLAKKCVRAGFAAITVDLRGHGMTGGDIGKLTRKEYLDDVVTVYDYLAKRRRINGKKMIVFGSSFGGYMAALLVGKRKPAGIVLRAPANIRDEKFALRPQQDFSLHWDKTGIPWHRKRLRPQGTYALSAVRRFPGHVLLIELGKDKVIPRQTILNYANAVKDKRMLTHTVLKGAPHGSPKGAIKRRHDELVLSWLKERLPES